MKLEEVEDDIAEMAVALILGGGQGVWDDAKAALRLFTPDAVFAINDMIPRWRGRVDYAVTLHQDKMSGWIRERQKNGFNTNCETWSYKFHHANIQKVTSDWQGSSGLFAVKIAIEERFKVVLAGVPMTYQDRHFIRRQEWPSATGFQRGWNKHYEDIRKHTRSMSGWTRKLLGEPTPQWLQSIGSAPPDHDVIEKEKGDARAQNAA